VKAPVAVPFPCRRREGFRSYPGSLWSANCVCAAGLLERTGAHRRRPSTKKSARGERPRYDQSTNALVEALQKHAVVLIPGNSSLEIRRALVLGEEWKVNSVIYGGQMGYEVARRLRPGRCQCWWI